MVDCLEELWTHADALLEQLRRMERSPSNLTGEGREDGAAQREAENALPDREAARSGNSQVYQMEAMADELEALRRTPAKQAHTAVSLVGETGDGPELTRRPDGAAEDGAKQGERTPLAARLDRLDRAVSVAFGEVRSPERTESRRAETAAPAGRRTAGTDIPAYQVPGTDWPGDRPASGEGADWVEQADRAFRRDSRRYDGGFYLY